MKICFWYDDTNYCDDAYLMPDQGNDGMAGTQYEYAMLMKYYSKLFPQDSIFAFHTTKNRLLPEIVDYIYKDTNDALAFIESQGMDIVVFTVGQTDDTYKAISDFSYNVKFIAWAHNHIPYHELVNLRNNKKINRVVCCGRELYDMYIDDIIINKMCFIFNMYKQDCLGRRKVNDSRTVVYVGALTYNKGFHVLAKQWKDIVIEVPDAELFVAGTGKLYNSEFVMGEYGLAEENYEKVFMPYLLDSNGSLLDSVHFLGIVGKEEKKELFSKTKVGVVNPTGRTECCSISALEMGGGGIPVASYNGYGMVDVIENGHTGLLSRNDVEFRRNVIKLLKNEDLNIEMGNNGAEFIKNKFSPEKITQEWHDLFEDVVKGQPPRIIFPSGNYLNRGKWIRIINSVLKRFPLFKQLPSMNDYNEMRKRF